MTNCGVLYAPPGTEGLVTGGAMSLKVAATFLELSMITAQVLPLTSAQPDQEVKEDPGSGTAVRITLVLAE